MSSYRIIKLRNLSPLHMGDGRDESPDTSSAMVSSDSILAALASAYAPHHSETEVKALMEHLTISSSLPWIGEHLFLPKPIGRLAVVMDEGDEEKVRKQLKKIAYLDSGLWEKMACGEHLKVTTDAIHGPYLCEDADLGTLSINNLLTRPSVDRENSRAESFYFSWHYFNPNGGLYFILGAMDDAMFETCLELFNHLGEQGIGSNRSGGGGHFEVEGGSMELRMPQDADALMLLSNYIPTREEMGKMDLDGCRFKIVRRGGYMAGSSDMDLRHLRRREVYMFEPGSLFGGMESLSGKVVDLAPQWNSENMHPVYRSGKPLWLPIKTNQP